MWHVYKTTNKINNKYYIGVHKSGDINNDSYLGSGEYLKKSINVYGIKNFEREIIGSYKTKKLAYFVEKLLVNEDTLNDEYCMNLRNGGEGGYCSTFWKKMENDEYKKIWKRKVQIGLKSKFNSGYKGGFYGKLHTNEYKKDKSKFFSEIQKGKNNSQYGTMWIYNEDLKENKKIKKDDFIPHGWKQGRKMKYYK